MVRLRVGFFAGGGDGDGDGDGDGVGMVRGKRGDGRG